MTVLKSICIINNQDDDTALSWEVYMEKKQVFIILGVVVFITVSIIAYCLLYGNQYTVKFDTNGGTEIEQQVVRVGDKVVEPKEPVKEGYEFVEWQLDGKKYNFETKVKRNMVLTASWQKIADAAEIFYRVTFDSNGGSEVDEQYISVGETVTEPTNPVKDGYTFNGWYYNDTKYDFDKKVSQDMVLTARWKEKAAENIDKDNEKEEDNDDSNELDEELKVGDRVRIVGKYASSSTSSEDEAIHSRAIGWKRVILKIYEGREYPYRVGNETGTTGFFKAESLEKIG